MTDKEIHPKVEISVDPDDMRQRRFTFSNVRSTARGEYTARELEKNDPSLTVSHIGLLDVILVTTDSSDWVASSGEELGTERQAYVLRRLGEIGL